MRKTERTCSFSGAVTRWMFDWNGLQLRWRWVKGSPRQLGLWTLGRYLLTREVCQHRPGDMTYNPRNIGIPCTLCWLRDWKRAKFGRATNCIGTWTIREGRRRSQARFWRLKKMWFGILFVCGNRYVPHGGAGLKENTCYGMKCIWFQWNTL